jgi:hypothetical protein
MTPRFQITRRVTAGLTRIERARGFLDAAKLSEDCSARLDNDNQLTFSHASDRAHTRLECRGTPSAGGSSQSGFS